jgi:hypothetical protein
MTPSMLRDLLRVGLAESAALICISDLTFLVHAASAQQRALGYLPACAGQIGKAIVSESS